MFKISNIIIAFMVIVIITAKTARKRKDTRVSILVIYLLLDNIF